MVYFRLIQLHYSPQTFEDPLFSENDIIIQPLDICLHIFLVCQITRRLNQTLKWHTKTCHEAKEVALSWTNQIKIKVINQVRAIFVSHLLSRAHTETLSLRLALLLLLHTAVASHQDTLQKFKMATTTIASAS